MPGPISPIGPSPATNSSESRPHSRVYQIFFLALGLIGTAAACLAKEERLYFIWSAWCIAGATAITLWVGVETARYLLNETQQNRWPGEPWLPLRGRWLRILIFTPLLLPGLVFIWVVVIHVLLQVGLPLRMIPWP